VHQPQPATEGPERPAPASTTKKIGYLESLRGVAALVVVFGHFAVSFYPALWWRLPKLSHTPRGIELAISVTPLNLLYNGSFSVSIFFVLSGFVLTYRFFRDRDTRVRLLPVFAKRYTRLLYPILFSNALAYILLLCSWYRNQPAAALTRSSWLGIYWRFDPSMVKVLYESFFAAFFRGETTYNGVLWTMGYEFYGSLLVFTCLALFGRHPKRDWFYLVLALVWHRSFYLAFVLGMVLSDLVTRDHDVFRNIRHKGFFVAILLAGLFLGSVPESRPLTGTIYEGLPAFVRTRTWQTVGAAMVMLALLHSRRLQSLFSKRPFLFLGRISFSLYVLHQLFIGSLSCWLFLWLLPLLGYHAAVFLSAGISLPLMFVASHYTHRYVDAPGIRASQAVFRTLSGWMPQLKKKGA
jgi:peptidoglycan/LPS O-acetylase OafA/YrhL